MASFKARIEVFLDGDCENEAREFVAETMRDVFRQICPFTSPMIGWRFCDQEDGSQPKTMPAANHDNPRSASMFNTDNLSPLQRGRLHAALAKHYRYDGAVKPLRQHIEELAAAGPLDLSEGDGMIDYSRTHFNRLSSVKEQDAYIARLRAKRYFYVNDWVVPKLVYDAIKGAMIDA